MEQIITDKGFVGWRGYDFLRPHFLSTMGMVLQPYEVNESFCAIDQKDHLSPDEQCTCGFYAFKTLEELCRQGYHHQKILAEVAFWGKTIECEKGWRSQYCYPIKLYANNDQVRPYIAFLADTYGVPYEDNIKLPFIPRTTQNIQRALNPQVSFEQLWELAFNDKVEISMRRFVRNQVRQRVYMKRRSCEERIKGLTSELDRQKHKLVSLQNQMAAIDALKEELK